ncbi:MAG: hypothetical protein KGQ44_06080 [Betaproteobacteria bacterium]|nr:hypothetical protein [Betaproteobacteria bacterium]
MIKRVCTRLLALFVFSLTLSSCGGGGGSPASPPTISGVSGDGQVQISWTALSGIYYWIFFTQSNQTFDINNPPNTPQQGFIGALPTYVVGNLTNGLTTSMVVNAHAGNQNGPGGPQSNDVIVTPRLVFADNTTTTLQCSANCPPYVANGVAFGDAGTQVSNSSTIHVYVAVGNNASISTSLDGLSWTAQPSGALTYCSLGSNTLNGVAFNNNTFYAVGANGTLCYNSQSVGNYTQYGLTNVVDTSNNWAPNNAIWYPASSKPNSTTTLYAVAGTQQTYGNNGSNNFVAVGSSGAVWDTTDGLNWTSVYTASHDLYAINFVGSCAINSYQWIAVGAGGTIIHSTENTGSVSSNWSSVITTNIGTTNNLHGVACSPNTTLNSVVNQAVVSPSTNTPVFVAVGDHGTVLTSSDGNNWTLRLSNVISSNDNLTAVYALNRALEGRSNNTQFVATSSTGNIYTSTDGITWVKYSVNGSSSLNAIVSTAGSNVPNGSFGTVPFSYVAVGSLGSSGFSAVSQ